MTMVKPLAAPARGHDVGATVESTSDVPSGMMDTGTQVLMLMPEQQRALAYARLKGTEAAASTLRAKVAGTFAVIESMVSALDAATAGRSPAPGAWSVHEVVDHLVVSEQESVAELAQLLSGRSTYQPIPAGLQSTRPFAKEWPALLADFRAVHQELLAQLDQATDATPMHASAAVEMVVKCEVGEGNFEPIHWIERFDWKAYSVLLHAHNREHCVQIQRILAKVGSSR